MGPIADTHKLYKAAKERCENPENPRYPICGGKGIKFLLPPFAEFIQILGTRPARHRLARLDPTKDYVLENVKWEFDARIPIKEFKHPVCASCKTPLKNGACPTDGPDCNHWKRRQPAVLARRAEQEPDERMAGADATPEALAARRAALLKRFRIAWHEKEVSK